MTRRSPAVFDRDAVVAAPKSAGQSCPEGKKERGRPRLAFANRPQIPRESARDVGIGRDPGLVDFEERRAPELPLAPFGGRVSIGGVPRPLVDNVEPDAGKRLGAERPRTPGGSAPYRRKRHSRRRSKLDGAGASTSARPSANEDRRGSKTTIRATRGRTLKAESQGSRRRRTSRSFRRQFRARNDALMGTPTERRDARRRTSREQGRGNSYLFAEG